MEGNGVGIDEATRQRLFELFFTTKDADPGTGLGLSIIYAIVRNHEGQIDVESEQGVGTTFKVLLPVVEESYPQMNADERGLKADQDLQKPAQGVLSSDEKVNCINYRLEIQTLKTSPKRGNNNLSEPAKSSRVCLMR